VKIFEFAIYRYATRLMTPAELVDAQILARAADAGDEEAAAVLRSMVLYLIHSRSPN